MNNDTVHSRMQTNGGFVTGPNHMMGPMLGAMPQPAKTGQVPPNYRDSDSPGEDCSTCEYFDEGTRMCSKYEYKVAPIKVCDSYEPKGEDQPEMDVDSGAAQSGQV